MVTLPLWGPLAVLTGGAFCIYVVARYVLRRNALLAALAFGIQVLSLVLTIQLGGDISTGEMSWMPIGADHAMLAMEPGALLIVVISQSLCGLVTLYSGRYLALDQRYEDYYPLLLGLSASVFGMALAADLFVLYLFTGLGGIISYVLVAFRRQTSTAVEAGYKYAIVGGMATTFMLVGLGYLLYSGNSLEIAPAVNTLGTWGSIGVALVLAGLAIKAAMVPGHTWLPDAHSRAPSSISAILSGILVEVHVYVFIKTGLGLGWPIKLVGIILIVIAVLNMIVGNLMALVQTYGKRMLGYSTIAQMGYILLAFGVGLTYGRVEIVTAAFFLLTAHAILKALAFLSKGICHFYCDATTLDDLDGLYNRVPLASLCFSLALAGLAGLPPMAGFMAKWQLVITLPTWDVLLTVLMLIFLINSILSLGYYLPPIYRLFKPIKGNKIAVSRWMLSPVLILVVMALGFGLFPQILLTFSERAARFMLGWGG